MSDCCSTGKENTCPLPSSKPGLCPSCGKKGKSVRVLTVKSMVRDHTRVLASVSYSFCRTADCEMVYFSDQAVFTKSDLKVRVGIKETAGPIPLCYCFDYSCEDICRDIEATGETSVLEEIKTEVQGGFCACEVKNPSGTCCLGDITHAIQEAKKRAAQTLHASP
jgi:Zinc binding domain